MNILTSFLSGTIFGTLISYIILTIFKRYELRKKNLEIKNQFLQIIDNLKNGQSKFKTRIKNTVLLETSLSDFGQVGIVYMIDRSEVSIIKEEKCLYTSDQLVDKVVLDNTISLINEIYGVKINDVVEVMGISISREDFEKNLNIQMKEIKKNMKSEKTTETTEIIDIVQNNSEKLDIDEILDKISIQGLESLTSEELEFLNNFK